MVDTEAQHAMEGDSEEEDGKAEHWVEDWEASELIYRTEVEESQEESQDEEEKFKESRDEEGDVEPSIMEGDGMNWMDEVVYDMDSIGGALGELDSLQKRVCNREPFTGMCGDNISTYGILREVLRSDLEDGN